MKLIWLFILKSKFWVLEYFTCYKISVMRLVKRTWNLIFLGGFIIKTSFSLLTEFNGKCAIIFNSKCAIYSIKCFMV